MASVRQPSSNRQIVHLASHSAQDSEVSVEVRMSKAMAEEMAQAEAHRIASLNADCEQTSREDVGTAVLQILSSALAISRVKNRTAKADQTRLKALIDSEVAAVRASRA